MVQYPLKEGTVKQLLTLAVWFKGKESEHKCTIISNSSICEGNPEWVSFCTD